MEQGFDPFREGAMPAHSRAEPRVGEHATVHLSDSIHDLLATVGVVSRQPFLEERRDRARQAKHRVPTPTGSRPMRSLQDRGDLVLGQAGEDRPDQNSTGYSGRRECLDRFESITGVRRPRLEVTHEAGIERRDRKEHETSIPSSEFP